MTSLDEETKTRCDVLVEFLEVAFHAILYTRRIYPSTIFQLRKKYDIPVYISTHPKVNEYISECLKTAKELLQYNSVKKIDLVIVNHSDKPIEKYAFEIAQSNAGVGDRYFVKTEVAFREYLLKMTVAEVHLDKLPDDVSFVIEITTNEQTSVRLNEDINQVHFPWVESDRSDDVMTKMIPIKTLDVSFLNLRMYIEK